MIYTSDIKGQTCAEGLYINPFAQVCHSFDYDEKSDFLVSICSFVFFTIFFFSFFIKNKRLRC